MPIVFGFLRPYVQGFSARKPRLANDRFGEKSGAMDRSLAGVAHDPCFRDCNFCRLHSVGTINGNSEGWFLWRQIRFLQTIVGLVDLFAEADKPGQRFGAGNVGWRATPLECGFQQQPQFGE